MKKLLIIPMLLAIALTANAKTTMEHRQRDLSAVINPRLDVNGVECALVKVYCDIPGIEFCGNILGDISDNGECKLIYMCEGTRGIGYKLDNETIFIEFAKLGIEKLDRSNTYKLTLDAADLKSFKNRQIFYNPSR